MQERTSPTDAAAQASSTAAPPLPEQVEEQLRKILDSPAFRKAPRHSRFLQFVVRKALAGQGDEVKEYLIGLEVFDREAGYDPGSEPIVRAEARRLRARLADYYRSYGQSDPVHIELPKGTYVPSFHRNGKQGEAIWTQASEVGQTSENSASNVAALQNGGSPDTTSVARHRRKILLAMTAAVVLAVASYAAYKLQVRKSSGLTSAETNPAKTIVLADFTNTTGDAVFDHSLRQGLASQLEQSPFLNLLPDQRIGQTLSLMSQPGDPRLTRELAREVCQRTGGSATVEGSIAEQAGKYLLELQAVDCGNGKLLAETKESADSRQQVVPALGHAAATLRRELGESLASVQRYDAPAENVTTPSLEALQAYTLASRAMMVKGDYEAAIPLFQRAISLDPNFAMAYARLGTSYENLDQTERAAENLRQAYALRQRVSDRERFYIDSHYDQLVTGDLVAARATYELWAQTYPSDEIPFINLGRTYAELGDYDKSLAAYEKARTLDPGTGLLYGNLVFSYLSVDRLDEARATAQEAQDRGLDSPWVHFYLYWVDFLQHDTAAMERELAGQKGKPGSDDLAYYMEADTAAYAGQLARAHQLTEQAAASAQHADQKDTAAGYQATNALHQALVGKFDEARQQAQAGLKPSNSKEVEAIAGLAMALAGDRAEAERVAAELARRYPENTYVRFNAVPSIEAAVALRRGAPEKAVEALAPAAPYEMGRGDLIWLYPVYLRALAYLAAHQGMAAAAEFQTIISHPGVTLNEPIGALAHLGLGRAYAMAGDTAKARTAYQDFFALWKNADSNLPILQQAKAEYAKIQ